MHYQHHGDVFFRAPVRPISAALSTSDDLVTHFRKYLDVEDFKLSLYLASPDLYNEAIKWSQRRGEMTSDDDKLILSLTKYWNRMCTRCTPFGNFAGIFRARTSDVTSLLLCASEAHYRAFRIDMDFVCELSYVFLKDPSVRKHLLYSPNNSLHKVGTKYRYVEYVSEKKTRQYYTREIDYSEEIDKILTLSKDGERLVNLAGALVGEGVQFQEAEIFINQLIDNQILVSDCEVSVTGNDAFSTLTAKINNLALDQNFGTMLESIERKLKIASSVQELETIRQALHSIAGTIPDGIHIQSDLFMTPSEAKLDNQVASEIVQVITDIITRLPKRSVARVDRFKEKFLERFETREIPLLLALDPEIGIGYDNTGEIADTGIVAGINPAGGVGKGVRIDWEAFDNFKLELAKKAGSQHNNEVEISESDLDRIGPSRNLSRLPVSAYIFGSLLRTNTDPLSQHNYLFLFRQFLGPSSSNLLGRFCYGSSEILENVKSYLADEEQVDPEVIFAEVVHLPQSKVGNILARPPLRRYEIPYISPSSVPVDRQIQPADIVVSVRDNEIVLRSTKLNRRIIPRLTSAHNYISNNLPVYKFLCDIQAQEKIPAEAWDWGVLESSPVLPRITYKRIVIRRAQWTMNLEIRSKKSKKSSDQDVLSFIDRFRKEYRMPQQVLLVEFDNELLLDLDSAIGLKLLCNALKKNSRVCLVEFITKNENCIIRDTDGNPYLNEVIIPLTLRNTTSRYKFESRSSPSVPGTRLFLVGSEWLYVKIYSGPVVAEQLIREVIHPLAQELTSKGIIDKWFFVKYTDPNYHTRIRFHGEGAFWSKVLEELSLRIEPFLQSSIVSKIQVDTYSREIERYGVIDLSLTESLFHLDSIAVSELLVLLEDDSRDDLRMIFALRGIDGLLSDFALNEYQKMHVVQNLFESFFAERGNDKLLMRQIDLKYRAITSQIRSFMTNSDDDKNEIVDLVEILRKRSSSLRSLAAQILVQLGSRRDQVINGLLPSYIHMFLNRLFVNRPREQEIFVYHFLTKYYNSDLRRQKR